MSGILTVVSKVFVLGIDGGMIEFLNRPELPTFQKILAGSSHGTLFSRPALTPAAWTSMVTGKNPGKHGIFDFRIGEELFFSTDKKSRELWDYAKSIVINVPMTYPAKAIDGVMVSGMMSPDLDSDLVYPPTEQQYLKDLGYVIEPEIELGSIKDSIVKRIELVAHYLQHDWQLFFVVFREFDVLHHFFWGNELGYYRMLDTFLGDVLVPYLDEEGVKLMIVSDHGFAPVDTAVNIELLLDELGYQDLYRVGGWGALYGMPDDAKREEVVESLRSYSVDGEEILSVYKNEDIYWGSEAKRGPDILVWPKRELGYTFKMRSDEVIVDSGKKNGCHLETGMVVLRGFEGRKRTPEADIKDVFPTVLTELGVDLPPDLDGEVI